MIIDFYENYRYDTEGKHPSELMEENVEFADEDFEAVQARANSLAQIFKQPVSAYLSGDCRPRHAILQSE